MYSYTKPENGAVERSVKAHPVEGLSPITAGRSVIAAQADHDVVHAARLDQNDDLSFPFGNDT